MGGGGVERQGESVRWGGRRERESMKGSKKDRKRESWVGQSEGGKQSQTERQTGVGGSEGLLVI